MRPVVITCRIRTERVLAVLRALTLSVVLGLGGLSASALADDTCAPGSWPCSGQLDDSPLEDSPQRLKFQARVAVATMLLESGYFENVTVKLLQGSGEVLCKETFSNVLVDYSVMNLVVGANMTCEVDKVIVENASLSLQICPQDEDNCLVPIAFQAAPYAIKSSYASVAEKAHRVNEAGQAHYAFRMSSDRDLGFAEAIANGYFDFEPVASFASADALYPAQDDFLAFDGSGFVSWRHESGLSPTLHIAGKNHATDAMVELDALVLSTDQAHITGALQIYPGDTHYPGAPDLLADTGAVIADLMSLATKVGLFVSGSGAEIIGSTAIFGDADDTKGYALHLYQQNAAMGALSVAGPARMGQGASGQAARLRIWTDSSEPADSAHSLQVSDQGAAITGNTEIQGSSGASDSFTLTVVDDTGGAIQAQGNLLLRGAALVDPDSLGSQVDPDGSTYGLEISRDSAADLALAVTGDSQVGSAESPNSLSIDHALAVSSTGSDDTGHLVVTEDLTVDGQLTATDGDLPVTAQVQVQGGSDTSGATRGGVVLTRSESGAEWFVNNSSGMQIVDEGATSVTIAALGAEGENPPTTQIVGATELSDTVTLTGDFVAEAGLLLATTDAGYLYPLTQTQDSESGMLTGSLSIIGEDALTVTVTGVEGTGWQTTGDMEAQGDYLGQLPDPCVAGDDDCSTRWYWGINGDECVYIHTDGIPIDIDSSATYSCTDSEGTDCTGTQSCDEGFSCVPDDPRDMASGCTLTKTGADGEQCEEHDCYTRDVVGWCGDGICDLNESCDGEFRQVPDLKSGCEYIGWSDDNWELVVCDGDTMDQGDAQDLCEAMDGDLASIHSQRENDLIHDAIPGTAWIGFIDDVSANGTNGTQDAVFVWSDGSTVAYTNWKNSSNPNSSSGSEPNDHGSGEDCTEMYTTGLWNDQSCNDNRYVVCKIPTGSYVNDTSYRCQADCGTCGSEDGEEARTYGRDTLRPINGSKQDEVWDCWGDSRPLSWVGDGQCDDSRQSQGGTAHFNCAAFDFDGGDCCETTCNLTICIWGKCIDLCAFLDDGDDNCKDPSYAHKSDYLYDGAGLGERACEALEDYFTTTDANVQDDMTALFSGADADCLEGGDAEDELFCQVARAIHEGQYAADAYGGHHQCAYDSDGHFELVEEFAWICSNTATDSCEEGEEWLISCDCPGEETSDMCQVTLIDHYVTEYCAEGGIDFDAEASSDPTETSRLACLDYLVNDYDDWENSVIDDTDPLADCKGANCRGKCPSGTLPVSTASPLRCCSQELTLRKTGATGTLYITADNRINAMYVNGLDVTENLVNADGDGSGNNYQGVPRKASSYDVGSTNGVLALDLTETMGTAAGLLATFEGGSVSDATWKCIDKYTLPSEEASLWTNTCYDDSDWPYANAQKVHDALTIGLTTFTDADYFDDAAWWIWVTDTSVSDIYCRAALGDGPSAVCDEAPPEIYDLRLQYSYDLDSCGNGTCEQGEYEGTCSSDNTITCFDYLDCPAESDGTDATCQQSTNSCPEDCSDTGSDQGGSGSSSFQDEDGDGTVDTPVYLTKTQRLTCYATEEEAGGASAQKSYACQLRGDYCSGTYCNNDTDADGLLDTYESSLTGGDDVNDNQVDDRYDAEYTGGVDYRSWDGDSQSWVLGANGVDDAFEAELCLESDDAIDTSLTTVTWTVTRSDGSTYTYDDALLSLSDAMLEDDGVCEGDSATSCTADDDCDSGVCNPVTNMNLLHLQTATCDISVSGYCQSGDVYNGTLCTDDSDCNSGETCGGANAKSVDVLLRLNQTDTTCDGVDDDGDGALDEDYADPNCDGTSSCSGGTPSCDDCSEGYMIEAGVCTPCACDGHATCTHDGCVCNDGYQDYADSPAPGVDCEICPAGYYSTGGEACQACPDGESSSEGAASCDTCECGDNASCAADSGECICNDGYVANGSGTCDACPAGSAAQAGASACEACDDGDWSAGAAGECASCNCSDNASCDASTGVCLCDAGYGIEANQCALCEAGEFSTDGDDTCWPCEQGTKSSAGASGCETCGCDANAVCDAAAATDNCSCIANYYGDGGACTACPCDENGGNCATSAEGSTELTQCQCPANTYLSTDTGMCVSCPDALPFAPAGSNSAASCTDTESD